MSLPSVKLGDICHFVRGPFGGSLKKESFVERGYAVYEQQHAIYNQFSKIRYFIDKDKFAELKRFELSAGDLVMSCSGTMGKVAKVPSGIERGIINQALLKLTPSNMLDLDYFAYWMGSESFQNKINENSHGAAVKNVASVKILKEIKIPLPPLPEQKKIAEILDAADSLRQKDQQLIEHYNTLSQSLFLEMFGDPVSNAHGFTNSSVGEQCLVKGGKRVPKGEKLVKENTGYPYIKAGNIKEGKVTSTKMEYLTPLVREKLKRYIVNEGDVCVTVVGANIGDIGIVPKELHLANLTENANKLPIKNPEVLNGLYLCFALQADFIQNQIKQKTMAVGVPKLALFRIQQLEILVPPIDLQNDFLERIKIIEQQKVLAVESLKKSKDLFNSLLQKAFKGELTS